MGVGAGRYQNESESAVGGENAEAAAISMRIRRNSSSGMTVLKFLMILTIFSS